jgi:hypothetical protein
VRLQAVTRELGEIAVQSGPNEGIFTAMRLVLFDIDGTLLRAQGLGLAVMERVGRRLLGPAFTLDGIDFGGALDPWIFRQAATRLGHDDPSHLHPAFRDAYLAELARALDQGEQPPILLPGVIAALAAFRGDPTATLGLVTGNYARAVPLKLRAAGIDPEQFVVGAFGDDAPTGRISGGAGWVTSPPRARIWSAWPWSNGARAARTPTRGASSSSGTRPGTSTAPRRMAADRLRSRPDGTPSSSWKPAAPTWCCAI